MRRNGFGSSLGVTHRLNHLIDVLRDIGNLHLKRQRVRCLQKHIIELINKASGRELDITEIKYDNILLAVLYEQP